MSRVVPDRTWAAMTIYQEAKGEPYAGKLAVAGVIRNRLRVGWWGHDVVATCLAPMQFSGWNSGVAFAADRESAARMDDTDPRVQDCFEVWDVTADPMVVSGVDDALFYYAPDHVAVAPVWAKPEKFVAVVGAHHFYRA